MATTLAEDSDSPEKDPDRQATGLVLRVSDAGEARPSAETPAEPSDAEPLGAAESLRVLERLPHEERRKDDRKPFAFRESSLPAPRSGETLALPFPPPDSKDAPDASPDGPLRVLRFSPEGDVDLAPHLSITFSHPMVALDTHAALAAKDLPVRIEPEPLGEWRWVGTRTLYFEARRQEGGETDGNRTRLPMATTYRVEVPAGTRAASGAELAKAAVWTFATPPVRVESTWPVGKGRDTDALMALSFDQGVDAAAIIEFIAVQVGLKRYPIRLATAEEIAADEPVRRRVAQSLPGRVVVFRSTETFPNSARVDIRLLEGAPSTEGTRKTDSVQESSFTTYGPLEITEHRCGWGRRQKSCPPGTPFHIEFSNQLDDESLKTAVVSSEPEISFQRLHAYGNTLQIQGITRGRTKYRITLGRDLRDIYGQSLAEEVTLEFEVDEAPKQFRAPIGPFSILDPFGKPKLSVFSTNIPRMSLRAYAVRPTDWGSYRQWMRDGRRNHIAAPFEAFAETTLDIESKNDELVETEIDLAPFFEHAGSQVLVVAEPVPQPNPERPQRVYSWLQKSDVVLDAMNDADQLWVFASSLETGEPKAGVTVEILPHGHRATTDATGRVRFDFESDVQVENAIAVGIHNDEVTLLPESASRWGGRSSWHDRSRSKPAARFFTFDDRGLYRPGETVRVKGYVRAWTPGPEGDLRGVGDLVRGVSYLVRDPRNNEIAKGEAELTALGTFDLQFDLPDSANLGTARIDLQTLRTDEHGDRRHRHVFRVEEFRRPEFEVSARVETEGPHIVGASADVAVEAKYYAGGGLPGAPVDWNVTSTEGSFTPPGRGDFSFGVWTPWWGRGGRSSTESRTETHSGSTDAGGVHRVRLDFDAVSPPRAWNVSAFASITDVNRQTWSANASLLVHPANVYVGLRTERTFIDPKTELPIEFIVCDLDGELVEGVATSLELVRVEWGRVDGEWTEEETPIRVNGSRSGDAPVESVFAGLEGGRYRVRARIEDSEGRANESELTVWVAGGKRPKRRGVDLEEVQLIPDKKEYADGETARILVQAPFAPAYGTVTWRRQGVVHIESIEVGDRGTTLEVPIEASSTPNLRVQVDLAGASDRVEDDGTVNPRLPKRPAYATGEINLSIPPSERTLEVAVEPLATAIEPGGKTTVVVRVRDASGRPAADAEVAVVVVDEAVLALTGYQMGDIVSAFYQSISDGVRDYRSRRYVLLKRIEELLAMAPDSEPKAKGVRRRSQGIDTVTRGAMPARSLAFDMESVGEDGAAAEGESGGGPIDLRTNFDALAVFAPRETTDADGVASLEVELPDSLTRYRVMAVAVHGGQRFGQGESAITARLPLMVRPSPPRFLNFGDRFELPVVLQNQTDETMQVKVALRVANLELLEGAGRRVEVPANDRVEVRFPATTVSAGTTRVEIAAVTGSWADAAQVEWPVWTPATTEAFATYGEIAATEGEAVVVQPVAKLEDVVTQFGGLEVTTSSTALQALTDAVIYLVDYPYGCAEQIASRVLATAALRDVLSAFEADGLPKADVLIAQVEQDIAELGKMQHDNGGFGFWSRRGKQWPWLGVHAAHSFVRARQKGFSVPDQLLQRSTGYIENIRTHIPDDYPDRCKRAIESYALHVRALLGSEPGELTEIARQARSMFQEHGTEGLSMESLGWLLRAMHDDGGSRKARESILAWLGQRAVETAATAEFTTSYADSEHLILHSSRRTDAVLLESLLSVDPRNGLLPKVVRGLLAHRKKGRWLNTQENVFVLLALDRYFAVYEKETPHFVARMWLGDQYAGEASFEGRTTKREHLEIPMQVLTSAQGAQDIILQQSGKGRLYYRLGLRYAPKSLRLDPLDRGFTVERTYEAVDDADDVRRAENGEWLVRLGARVRVRLTMVAPTRRYHVALVDPLPAGFEAINASLEGTEPIPRDEASGDGRPSRRGRGYWHGWWRWYEHQNLRDERAEAFTSYLWAGVHSYSYVAKATTPGRFVVPPTKAEEMYMPETFGRSASEVVVVE